MTPGHGVLFPLCGLPAFRGRAAAADGAVTAAGASASAAASVFVSFMNAPKSQHHDHSQEQDQNNVQCVHPSSPFFKDIFAVGFIFTQEQQPPWICSAESYQRADQIDEIRRDPREETLPYDHT